MNRIWVVLLLAVFSAIALATDRPVETLRLLNAATSVSSGTAADRAECEVRTLQATGTTSSGTGAATIIIEGSNLISPAAGTNVDWVTIGTIVLTLGTTQTGEGFVSQARWRHIRARVSAISGTGASVDAYMGC